MTHDDIPAYGLWSLVLINSAVFIFFAFTFFKPQTKRDWRSFSAFSAFLVALFTEMYGFPLTIYLLSGWLQSRYPGVDWFSHDAGHLLEMMFGWKTNPHFGPFHLLSFAFIGGGFLLLSAGWRVLYEAQRRRLERIVRPRAGWLAGSWARVPTGIICLVLAVIITLPVPLGHVVPGTAISVLSLGLIERDGIAIAAGIFIAALGLVLVIIASAGILNAARLW